jgi:hypothetical protein
MLIPLLTEYEKEHISERQPYAYRALSRALRRGDGPPHPGRQWRARSAAAGASSSPLSARRVIKFADYSRADSTSFAGEISRHPTPSHRLLAAVHFMAESADVAQRPSDQQVILPIWRRRVLDG